MRTLGPIVAAACLALVSSPGRLLAQEPPADAPPATIAATAPAEAAVVTPILAPVPSPTPIADALAAEAATLAADPQASGRPVAITYSDGYYTRAKIHKYASIATLPLFAAEFALGQSLYNDPHSLTSSKRGAHAAVGAGMVGLFGLNSFTGIWNLWDSRGTPGHTRRLIHGIVMLAAEGGFVAAEATAPGHSRNALVNFDSNKATHRDIAFVSMGVGTAGYLFMLLTKGQ